MNAVVIQNAGPGTGGMFGEPSVKTAIIQIDAVNWSSPVPRNSGEAQTFNDDARAIVSKLTTK